MDERASYNRFHHHHIVLQSPFQGSRRHAKTGKKKGGIQNSDLGEAHRKPVADGDAEVVETAVEFLGTVNNSQNNTDVLC